MDLFNSSAAARYSRTWPAKGCPFFISLVRSKNIIYHSARGLPNSLVGVLIIGIGWSDAKPLNATPSVVTTVRATPLSSTLDPNAL